MDLVTAIVETPKGSGFKYKYEPGARIYKLHKTLPAGMVFPFDFGFIPDTLGEDGDPLDIIVIAEFPTFAGCVVDCRLIGGIKVEQTKNNKTVRNDRFIGIAAASQLFANINSIGDMPGKWLDEAEAFFKNYVEQGGQQFKALGRISSQEAFELIKEGKQIV